ncbi:MAG: hypothetical protein J5798_03410 [Spirochaetaceae bacterium]|nr:hypothetical protein [Spirochaetaceae bacterium]
MNAKQSLSSISANQDLWVEQFRQEMFERDFRSGLSAAKEEGRSEAKLEAARNMLIDKLGTLEQIARCTDLPLETVQHLAEELHTKA